MAHIRYIFLLIIIITGSYIFMSPAISYRLIPQKRNALLTSFLSDTQKNNLLDSQRYWEFREFYSPGTFVFKKDYSISPDQMPKSLKTHFSVLKTQTRLRPYLTFHSAKIDSFDALLSKKIDLTKAYLDKKYLIKNKSLILLDAGNYYSLLSITSSENIKKANGFFEDKGTPRIPQDEYYLTVAVIQK